MKLKLIAILFILSLISCNDNEEIIAFDDSNPLIGFWSEPIYAETTTTFKRVNSLPEDTYGISFQNKNILLENKNAGWCGTPPITYSSVKGNWSKNNSIISMSSPFWGGVYDSKWKLISVDEHELVISMIHDN